MNKISINVSDKEILYHLFNELGKLGLVTVDHLQEYYTKNNMDNYDIFKSIADFSFKTNEIAGNNSKTIVSFLGKGYLYKSLVSDNILSSNANISSIVKLLAIIYNSSIKFNYSVFSYLNKEQYKNDELLKKAVFDLLEDRMEVSIARIINNDYFKICLDIIFNSAMDIDDFTILLFNFINNHRLALNELLLIMSDFFKDDNCSGEKKILTQHRILRVFIDLLEVNSLHKLQVIKARFTIIDDVTIGKFLEVTDNMKEFINNNHQFITYDEIIKFNKFLDKFNKYAVTRLL